MDGVDCGFMFFLFFLEIGVGYPGCFGQRVRKRLKRKEIRNWRAQKSAQVIENKGALECWKV